MTTRVVQETVQGYSMKIRCVSGNIVPHPDLGHLKPGADGYARIVLSNLEQLMTLVEWWDCPVTVAPPGETPDTRFWVVELEDGLHEGTELAS